MKNTILFILLLFSGSVFSQTVTRDTIRVPGADSTTVIVNTTTTTQGTGTVNYTFPIRNTVTTYFKIANGTQPANQLPVIASVTATPATITLPVNSVNLTSVSSDPDGSIVKYEWTRVSGTGSYTIVSANAANTSVTGLAAGTYGFRLVVTDNDGGSASATVSVIVNPEPIQNNSNFQGYGSQTPGGTGQQIVTVTTLSASGAGSIAAAWGSNKTIQLKVSGVIKGWRMPSQAVSFLTLDGTTSPNGVTFEGSSNNKGTIFAFDGSGFNNIIIKNIRVRGGVGAQDNDGDGINVVNGANNIVFDHVSSSGNNDGNLDLTSGANNITVQNCIFGGGLGYDQTASWWSGTMLIAYTPTKNLSVHHNLFVPKTSGAPGERAPYIHAGVGGDSRNTLMVDFRNNAVINWGPYGSGFGYNSAGHLINNYYKSTSNPDRAIDPDADPSGGSGSQFYISGNVSGDGASFPTGKKSSPFSIPASSQVTTQTACDAATFIKANAGCRPLDAVDQALINQLVIQNCSGTPPPIDPPDPGDYTGYTKIFTDYFNKDSDLDPQGHNQYANGFIDYNLKFEGAGSFASRTGNVSSGTRSEVQLNSSSTPLEGVADYYIYYKSFANGSGHDVQLHPGNNGSGTGFYHVNGKLVFRSVTSGTDTYKDYPFNYTPPLNKWIHVQWYYKWARSGGYSKIVFDGVTLVNATNIQVGDGSTPSFKLGQNYWSGNGDQINYDKFDLYKKN